VFIKLDFQKAYDKMIAWIIQIAMSDNTAININGDVDPYFRSSCGVTREAGGSYFPLLFNATVDILAKS
jgi:hypothetical protein